jgi:lipoprotein-anchoring transpeptidase ErfK/SrfK
VTLRHARTVAFAVSLAAAAASNCGPAQATMWPEQAVEQPEPAPPPPAARKRLARPLQRTIANQRPGRGPAEPAVNPQQAAEQPEPAPITLANRNRLARPVQRTIVIQRLGQGPAEPTANPQQAVDQPQQAPTPILARKRLAQRFQHTIGNQRLGLRVPGGRLGRANSPAERAKLASSAQSAAKPHGPLLIAVSIEKQHLRVYDADGLFAESPVSTGMRGHPTPMGVFSVIQKSRLHHSNIYSGAPMPFMQRITWSGVAMHAGVLPGYPASHGCIRMPMAFAVKLWGWSRLGARVIVAPDDVVPAAIAHPALITQVSPPIPKAPPPSETPVAGTPKADKAEKSEAVAALRPALSDRVQLADAATDLPAESLRAGVATDQSGADNTANPGPAEPTRTATATPKSADSIAADAPASGSPETAAQAEKAAAASRPADGAKTAALAQGASVNPDVAPAAKDQARPADGPRAISSKDTQPTQLATAATTQKNDATTPSEPVAVKRSGHVAVLISRKAARLYVRQNFEPWFDVPVTIERADQPVGTHVFTVSVEASDPTRYRWTVVSLPLPSKHRETAIDDPRSRHKRPAATTESDPSQPPAAADILDRVKIPDDALAKITAALAPGGSIIVSDHGLGDETGLGTDFIIPLR